MFIKNPRHLELLQLVRAFRQSPRNIIYTVPEYNSLNHLKNIHAIKDSTQVLFENRHCDSHSEYKLVESYFDFCYNSTKYNSSNKCINVVSFIPLPSIFDEVMRYRYPKETLMDISTHELLDIYCPEVNSVFKESISKSNIDCEVDLTKDLFDSCNGWKFNPKN